VFVASAPGKLVALGEYAVLDGAPALVLALDRYAQAGIGRSGDSHCHLQVRAPKVVDRRFAPGTTSGAALVDLVTAGIPLPWRAMLDSADFFEGPAKLGLGSSAAVLCAWAGAFAAYAQATGQIVPQPAPRHVVRVSTRLRALGARAARTRGP
jgi:mevalonate kinase